MNQFPTHLLTAPLEVVKAPRPELQTIEALVALMFIATVVGLLGQRIKLPYTVSLVVVGIALSAVGLVPHLVLTPDLLLMAFLPALLFEAAIHFPAAELRTYSPTIATLAAPGVIVAAFTTAFVMVLGFNTFHVSMPASFMHFLLFGTIIAATDPISVIALLRQLGVERKLSLLIEGESLFNDVTAIVLYAVVLKALTAGTFSLSEGLMLFITAAAGGIIVGTAFGMLASMLIRIVVDPLIAIALTTVSAYGSYLIAEKFHVSGVLATVVAGLFVGNIGKTKGMTVSSRLAVVGFWEYLAFFVSSIVFLLIGLELKLSLLVDQWGIIAFAFCAVLAARAVTVFLPLPFLRRLGQPLSVRRATVIWWGGLRGSLSMVLVLSIPDSIPFKDTLVAMTFGVVVMSVILQGSTMGWLLRALKFIVAPTEATGFLSTSLARLRAIRAQQNAISDLAFHDLPEIQAIKNGLTTERANILHALEERRKDPAFLAATSQRVAVLQEHLTQVARDSYVQSQMTNLLTDHEVAELTSALIDHKDT